MSSVALPIPPAPRVRGTALLGLVLILLFLGGFGAWATLAPLSSAAVAHGRIKAEGNRKTIQHLEGGIIREILVREGDRVQAGQVLLRLDDVPSSASAQAVTAERDALLAQEARLRAESEGADAVTFPPALLERASDPRVQEILEGQQRIFAERRAEMEQQLEVLQRQIEQSLAEIEGLRAQRQAISEQRTLAADEAASVATLQSRGYAPKTRLLALRREEASLTGQLGEKEGAIARAEQAVAERQAEMTRIERARASEIAQERRDIQTQLEQAEEKLRTAADVQARKVITAPVAGTVVDLRHFTLGGVIAPGEPILDIVPEGAPLVVEVQVQPTDIDVVHPGLTAEIRFPAFSQRSMPVVFGTVTQVSADAILDERTGASFYRAEVEIGADQLGALQGHALQSGMPAEVFIATGERTLAEYLLTPVRDSFRRAFREQ